MSEDREKILAAFGGKKGLIDSGIPSIIFLIIFNLKDNLHDALVASISVSAVITIIRLISRDTLQHAVSGFIGVLICAWFAHRTGNAADVYVPSLWKNLGFGLVYLFANLAGWPIIGLILGPILGENFLWRNDPARKAAYIRAGWLWVAMFFGRLAIQYPIYKSGNVNLLGTVNLGLGYPLYLAVVYGTWLIIKRVPTTKAR